jgi:hypothetical protein
VVLVAPKPEPVPLELVPSEPLEAPFGAQALPVLPVPEPDEVPPLAPETEADELLILAARELTLKSTSVVVLATTTTPASLAPS